MRTKLLIACALTSLAFGQSLMFSKVGLAELKSQELAKQESKLNLDPALQAKLSIVVQSYQEQLEERAKRFLGRQIDDGRFLIIIKVSLDINRVVSTARGNSSEKVTLWSLPQEITPDERTKLFGEKLTTESLPEFVKNIALEVTFDTTVPEAQAATLKKVLFSALNLNVARGDKITVERSSLVAPALTTQLQTSDKEASRLKMDLQQSDASKRSAEIKSKQQETILLAKIDSLEQNLATEKKQNANLELSVKDLKEQVSIYNTPLGEIKKLIKGLELPLTIFPIALLLLIATFVFWMIYQANATKRMQVFSEGLKGLSTAIQKGGKSGGSGGGNLIELPGTNAGLLTVQSNQMTALPASSNQPSDQELVELKQEAQLSWESLKATPYSALCCLKDWFTDDEGMRRVSAFLAAIGQEGSKKFLGKFSRQDKERIKPFLLNHPSRLQGYALIPQVERLTLQEFSQKPDFVEKIAPEFLISLSDTELANVMDEGTIAAASFALLSSSAARCSRLLELTKVHSPEDLLLQIRVSAALSYSEAFFLANQLHDLVKQILSDDDSRVTDHIAAILQFSGPRVQQSIGKLMGADLKLEARLRSAIVTFDDVLSLDNDLLSEILDPFASEDLATLLTGLPNDSQRKIASAIGKKLLIEVQAEFARISSKPMTLRKAQIDSQKLQQFLIQDLKRLQREGLWEPKRAAPTQSANAPQSKIEAEEVKQIGGAA